MHFTVHKDKNIDDRVNQDLEIMKEAIPRSLPGVEALVLVGGFGRGEGSVLIDDGQVQVVNDYDVTLITESPIPDPALKKCSAALAKEVGVPWVDLLLVPKGDLPYLPFTMFNYDLRYGGYLFWGDADLLEAMPRWQAKDMPLMEGKNLLFNRLVCLLECYSQDFLQRPLTNEESFFLKNQCSKAVLGCCDALLLLRKKYHHSYVERERRFAEEFRASPGLALVKEATAFKLRPHRMDSLAADYWFSIREFFVDTLWQIVNHAYSWHHPFKGWQDFGRLYDHFVDSPKDDVEVAEMYLAAAISGMEVDVPLLELAASRLEKLGVSQDADTFWEAVRRDCVKVWYKICHGEHTARI